MGTPGRLWGWALQGVSEVGHSRQSLGVDRARRRVPGKEKSSGRGEELSVQSNNPTPKVGNKSKTQAHPSVQWDEGSGREALASSSESFGPPRFCWTTWRKARRLQYPLIKEHFLNQIKEPYMVQGIFLNCDGLFFTWPLRAAHWEEPCAERINPCMYRAMFPPLILRVLF